jgi:Divergent InlB B-repeat domain
MNAVDALRHLRRVGLLALACCASLTTPAAARAATRTFQFTRAEQTFTVPAGVTSLYVVAIGAPGGTGFGNTRGGPGGKGAKAAADVAVMPGDVLYVEVGGPGGDASGSSGAPPAPGGFNGGGVGPTCQVCDGGGGGGGASDIRTASASGNPISSLQSRLIVAGGGGGGGGEGGIAGGAGGAGGHPGTPRPSSCTSGSGCGGGAGTQSAGGSGGASYSGCAPDGSQGVLGIGGEGGGASSSSCNDGGGGGGGLYGGGGGGSGAPGPPGTGGGGGGSSGFKIVSGTTHTSIGPSPTATPSITITYRPGLTVARGGTGAGTATSSPAGISCGTACSHAFQAGTVVTLTAKPASGSQFAGWSGPCRGTGKCKVTMNAARSVRATFNKVVPPPDTSITGVNPSRAKRKATFDFKGSGGSGALHFQCLLDSGGWKSCSSPKTYTGLSLGSHTFQARAIDARGRADPTPAKVAFKI